MSDSDTTSAPASLPGAAAPGADAAARRLRARCDRLLARSATTGRDTWKPASGAALEYDVRIEFLPVLPEGFEAAQSDPMAAVMATSYVARTERPRPVCFAWNGGPGSASIWLHLGALGPKRVATPDDGSMPAPPYAAVPNPESWFDRFDLVFIDPPHTGYSVAGSTEARDKLLSVDGDVAGFVDVIKGWLTRHRRWGSEVCIAGESYGTTRGAAIADKLQSAGVALTGVILVSCAMDLQSLVFAPGNDLPYALFLPGFALVAQYHGIAKGSIGRSPEAAREAGEAFVDSDYAAALLAGARLTPKRRSAVARRIAELTGLPQELVEERGLRIDDRTFFTEALRARGLQVGRLDARATAPISRKGGPSFEFDPGIEAIEGPYTMAAMHFFGELGLELDGRYEALSHDTHKAWNWNRGSDKGNGYASTSADLARVLRRNPRLRVFVASGRYDLGTPYSASDWSLAQLDCGDDVLQRVRHHYYDAGHMMYTRTPDLKQLKADLVAWLDG